VERGCSCRSASVLRNEVSRRIRRTLNDHEEIAEAKISFCSS
jgi:hypothetical protein